MASRDDPRILRPDTLAMTATLAMLTAIGPVSTDMYLPGLPAIADGLGTDVRGAQLTLSVFLVGFACGQFWYGPLSDRVGRRPVLLFGLGLFSVATLACLLAQDIATLVVARFVQALGAAAPVVLGRAVVRDLYDGARAGRELSRMGTIMGLAPAIAPVLGGLILLAADWRAIFGVILFAAAALAFHVARNLPETLRARSPEPLSIGAIFRGFGPLLANGDYRTSVALSTLAYGGLFAFISGSSFVLQEKYGLSEIAFGLSFGFVVLGYIAGTLIAQRLFSLRGLDGVIAPGVICLAAGGAGMLALALVDTGSSLEVTLPMAVYGLGLGLTMPQAMAKAMSPFPERAGAASSLLGMWQMGFAALIGIALAAALRVTALALPVFIAALGVAACALFLLSRPRARL
ncbi:MAG: Bcr/CflA family efflux MFS transporter [Salinarimonadaceae bacterium]|nr:MAG: Bcr/CflA family efflux MFS transporter [Salinarimonadaceae bacterium]